MSTLNTFTYEDSVDLIDREFEASKLSPLANSMKESGLVKVQTVPMGTGSTRRHKEQPIGELYANNKAEGGNVSQTAVQQGYYKDTISASYSKSISITIEMREQNKLQEIYAASSFIGGVCANREDLDLSLHISFGHSTSYVDQDGITRDISTGDGLSFFNTAHTLTGSATTYRNAVAANPAFSESALEVAEDLYVTNIFTNLGEQVGGNADILFSTDNPTTINSIRRVLQSTAQVSATNEGVVNVYEGKYTHKILNKIDMNVKGVKDPAKKLYWGLCDSTMSSFHNDIYSPAKIIYPSAENNGQDIQTLDWTYVGIDMRDSAVVAGRGMVLSKGDAS